MQMNRANLKPAILVSILLGLLFIGMQFVSTPAMPRAAASTVRMAQVIDPQVGAIVDRACRDCHSSGSSLPWYSHVAPVSWIVSKDVNDAREILDFSKWTDQPGERGLICAAVSSGNMPLASYTLIHQDAKLSKRDVDLLCQWAAGSGH